ncbi:hypothetical protein GCM10009660_39940 [Catellatospora bangladeshensis]
MHAPARARRRNRWAVGERWRYDRHAVRATRLRVFRAAPDGEEQASQLIRAGGRWAVEGVCD